MLSLTPLFRLLFVCDLKRRDLFCGEFFHGKTIEKEVGVAGVVGVEIVIAMADGDRHTVHFPSVFDVRDLPALRRRRLFVAVRALFVRLAHAIRTEERETAEIDETPAGRDGGDFLFPRLHTVIALKVDHARRERPRLHRERFAQHDGTAQFAICIDDDESEVLRFEVGVSESEFVCAQAGGFLHDIQKRRRAELVFIIEVGIP